MCHGKLHMRDMTSTLTLVRDDEFQEHLTPELHPEAPNRLQAIDKAFLNSSLDDSVKQDVLKSILELDPKARTILNKKLRSIQLRKTFSGLKKIIEPQAR